MTPEQELDLLVSEPEPGSYIQLGVAYPGSPKTYSYAAVEAAGKWYITGPENSARTWAGLVSWLKSKNAEITMLRQATSWENIL
jgi:hypothetical protein